MKSQVRIERKCWERRQQTLRRVCTILFRLHGLVFASYVKRDGCVQFECSLIELSFFPLSFCHLVLVLAIELERTFCSTGAYIISSSIGQLGIDDKLITTVHIYNSYTFLNLLTTTIIFRDLLSYADI